MYIFAREKKNEMRRMSIDEMFRAFLQRFSHVPWLSLYMGWLRNHAEKYF